MAVNDFVSLLLGEAGGKNAAERYNDMLHIASVVVNRSLATGLPVEDIIANSREFNAWGKDLPAGTEKFRDIAEQAIQQVMQNGPVTQATFYATPEAKGNLPSGLSASTRTASHEFFTDPQNRAIGTAGGYARVQPVSVPTVPPLPLSAPSPYRATDMRMMAFEPQYADLVPPTVAGRAIEPGAGLANLVPDVPAPPSQGYGSIAYAHPDRGAWNAGLTPETADSVRMMAAATPAGASVTSAYRSPSHSVEAAKRSGGGQHTKGTAYDLNLRSMSPQERANAVELAMMTGATRLGSYTNSPNMLHVDFGKGFVPTNGTVYAMHDKSNRNMSRAPDWFTRGMSQVTVPTPTARPDTPSAPSSLPNFSGGLSPRTAQQTSMAMYGLGLSPSPPSSVPALPFAPETTQAIPAAMTRPGTQGAPMSVPAAPPQMPSIPQSVMDGYREYGASRALAPTSEFPALPAFAPVPTPAPMQIAATDLPMAAPIPTPAPRNSEAAFLGGILGPATKQIGQNVKTNMQGGRINPFAGIPQAYRDAFRGLGNRMNGLFGGSLPAPTPFSVGRGMSAIEAVRSGGMAPGATAYSNSHPGASWSVNAYGFPEFSSQHGFTGRTPDGF